MKGETPSHEGGNQREEKKGEKTSKDDRNQDGSKVDKHKAA